ncbi:MAG TPA: tripartite tricarboxylate transporter substrate binding protein [Hyphomicrobiaceae bacterium]|nr:tripartite tricarboxylate transporter substrate binding protein [Hyphomicrobiaceae bacterium]
MMRMKLSSLGLAASLIAGAATVAFAQGFPSRPINLIVAFPAGGSTDIGARIVGAIAEKAFKQPVVIVNKGGAGGQIGWTELSRAKADGYTIGYVNLPATHTVVLDPERKAIYDLDSLVPVINQVLDPGIVWVRADSPFKSFKQLLEEAKAKPGTIRAATTGILSDDHLAILMSEEAMPGASFRMVHLAGGAAQLKEVLAGNIDVAFDNVGSIVKQVKAGQLRGLAVLDTQRSKFLPDVPTSVELGFKTVISSSTRGIAVPKGTPADVVKALADTFKAAMADPDHVSKLEEQGLAIKVMIGDEYTKYYRDNYALSKKYVEWAKSRPAK